MAYKFIKTEKKGHLFRVTIDRPEAMNSLHLPANQELEQAFDEFQEDSELWVAILTAEGDRAFCVGNDLKFQAKEGGGKVVIPKAGFGGITRRFDCFKPIIAGVNGFALGGGFEIALACDIIIAAENAVFGLPEPRVGMMPATGAHRLPRQVPYHSAMAMILTGKRISAIEAFRMGIVAEVVPAVDLIEATERWAGEVLQCAPLAVRACKQAAVIGSTMTLEEALRADYPLEVEMKKSDDYLEGPRAFVDKRKPDWIGR
jgi:enoyl-CoA hydratase/carnithine racemase